MRTVERNTSQVEITHKDEFFDASSRLKYEQTLGLNGETIVVHTMYDSRGNTVSKSNPYFPGSSVSGVSTAYDKLDRPTSGSEPARRIRRSRRKSSATAG